MLANSLKIKIKAYSWIAGTLGLSAQGTGVMEKTVESGQTLKGLLTELAAQSQEFAEKVYNPATGQINHLLIIVFNKKMVRDADLAQTVLQEGDVISLTPIIFGG